jgi:hypothetical protein
MPWRVCGTGAASYYHPQSKGAKRMQLSARNQLRGTITAVKEGAVMAEVVVTLDGGPEVVSAITVASASAAQPAAPPHHSNRTKMIFNIYAIYLVV